MSVSWSPAEQIATTISAVRVQVGKPHVACQGAVYYLKLSNSLLNVLCVLEVSLT